MPKSSYPRVVVGEDESSDFARKSPDIRDVVRHLEKVSKSFGLWWTLLALLGFVEDEVKMRSGGSRRGLRKKTLGEYLSRGQKLVMTHLFTRSHSM
jgi:hypothetical protein